MSNVLVIQSSISGEQSRSQCYSLAGSRGSGGDHRSPISRTAYALALTASVAFRLQHLRLSVMPNAP